MSHPYAQLPPTAFWRSAVAEANPARAAALFRPKFGLLPDEAIATAGSCFAQHIGRRLIRAGVGLLDVEPPPRAIPPPLARQYGYGLYSARYGNLYSARQFLQLLCDAREGLVDPDLVWAKEGRWHDALRPLIEPEGMGSVAEVMALRQRHLAAVARLFSAVSCVIFTLGLTEVWADRQSGRVFPTCPGVVAGDFDPERYHCLTLGFEETRQDLEALRALLQEFRPGMRMIVTVSPVPLTATASGAHVLVATTGSKAVLRAAAGEFAAAHADVDYFPSLEIITHPAAMGAFFRANLREVDERGIDAVMTAFCQSYGLTETKARGGRGGQAGSQPSTEEEPACEEILKEAFLR